jgi:hypothetical protein
MCILHDGLMVAAPGSPMGSARGREGDLVLAQGSAKLRYSNGMDKNRNAQYIGVVSK